MLRKLIEKYLKWTGRIESNSVYLDESMQELERLTRELEEKEQEIDQNHRLLEFENCILYKVARNESLKKVLRNIIQAVESFNGEVTASILVNEDGVLYDFWSPNLPETYHDKLKDGFPIGPEHGSCGAAAYYRRPVKVNDISTHPYWNKFPEVQQAALKSGFKKCYSEPILGTQGQLLGTLAVYFLDEDEPGDNYKRLIQWSTKMAAIGIERYYDELHMHYQNERLRGILDSQTDLVLRTNKNHRIIYANKAYRDIFGISWEEAKSGEINPKTFLHPDDSEYVSNNLKTLYIPPHRSHFMARSLTVEGYRYIDWQIYPIFDREGNIVEFQGSGRDLTDFIGELFDDCNKTRFNITNSG